MSINKNVSLPSDACYALSAAQVDRRIEELRRQLAGSLLILGHHYMRDAVIRHTDIRGDSFDLAKAAAAADAKWIVFCGVHFMVETADIVTRPDQKVFLPNVGAGCSLADMANIEEVEKAWEAISRLTTARIIPLTYINSNVELKAFCGRHGGIVCTSGNARQALEWSWKLGEKVLFFPDQYLGQNTAYGMGLALEKMARWEHRQAQGGLTQEDVEKAAIIFWDGYCEVHQRFSVGYIDRLREMHPDIRIIAHPECDFEVAQRADELGSTKRILQRVGESPAGSVWGVGTEKNLVERLQAIYQDKKIYFLEEEGPQCPTMEMVSEYHLLHQLENLAAGKLINQVIVEPQYKEYALVALERMLSLV